MSRARLVAVVLAALLALTAAISSPAVAAPAAQTTTDRVTEYTGEIGGAEFLVKVPARWDGTLMLWSHGWYGSYLPPEIELAHSPLTEQWLLDRGYALAASQYGPPNGWVVRQAVHDQLRLLDWIGANIGRPRRTISAGASMGGLVSVLVAERAPHRFAGVAPLCGALAGTIGTWNTLLDRDFTLRTLLAPELELVRLTDPEANAAAARQAIATALETPQGRARLALANAFTSSPGWTRALQPRSTDVESQVRQQAEWMTIVTDATLGGTRAQLEREIGGNPVGNVGVDYRRQLAASSERDLVLRAYAEAGIDLGADLDALAAQPRVRADRLAAARVAGSTPRGITPWPVITVHTIGDPPAPTEHARFYADQVGPAGRDDLRQLYLDRGQHCAFSAAEEIVALRALIRHMATGRWGDTSPAVMAAAVNAFAPSYREVLDWAAEPPVTGVAEPRFVNHRPAPYLRPHR